MEQTTTEVLVASPVKGGEATVLNEETYNSLLTMLRSPNEADHRMAQMILNTCDIVKSIYWIWRLGIDTGYSSRMVYLRTKASRDFRDKSRLFYIITKTPLKFAEFLNEQGWMTPEIYKYLEAAIIKTLTIQFRNTFYDVAFQIKERYIHLPENTNTIKIIQDENKTNA